MGDNNYIDNIKIIDSYTGAGKIATSNSIIKNILVNGYGLNGINTYGIFFSEGSNNIIDNINIRNGNYNGFRGALTKSNYSNIYIKDCTGTSTGQLMSGDSNSIYNNIILERTENNTRGLLFSDGNHYASNSIYKNIKIIKPVENIEYDIGGGNNSIPNSLYVEVLDSVNANNGRGKFKYPFIANKGQMTIFDVSSSTGFTPTEGDVLV